MGLFAELCRRSAILYEIDAWCLKESDARILQRIEISMVRAICGVQLRARKKAEDLMLMVSLNDAIDLLAMANNV